MQYFVVRVAKKSGKSYIMKIKYLVTSGIPPNTFYIPYTGDACNFCKRSEKRIPGFVLGKEISIDIESTYFCCKQCEKEWRELYV